MANDKPTLLELCAGTGGFTVAARDLFTPVWANDWDRASKRLYKVNHPGVHFDGRPIEDVPLTDLPAPGTIDLITAGFPCQPYSIEGDKLALSDPRADVFEHILRVVQHLQPRWLVCENVPHLVEMNGGAAWESLQRKAQTYLPGWHCEWTRYNTRLHSTVPQNRERVYIVWFRDSESERPFTFNKPAGLTTRHVSDLLEPEVHHKYYYDSARPGPSAMIVREAKESVHETGIVYQRRRNNKLRENMSGVIPTLMRQHGLSVPIVRDGKGVRRLTPRECFRAQGFPETYQFGKLSDTSLYELAGNAVTVPIAELVLKSLLAQG